MEKIKNKSYFALGILLGILIISIFAASFFVVKKQTKKQNNWELRSLENKVVLMNNGDIVEVIEEIVIDTLPPEDVKHLESGIPFLTKDEALLAVEDYE